MLKRFLLSILCLTMVVSFCACERSDKITDTDIKRHELWGTWEYTEDTSTKYEFNDDGTGCLYVKLRNKNNNAVKDFSYKYTYKIDNDHFHLNFEANSINDSTYTFKIVDDTLTIIGGENTDGGTYILKRIK